MFGNVAPGAPIFRGPGRRQSMEAFDSLPPVLREAMRNTIANYSAIQVAQKLCEFRGNARRCAVWLIERDHDRCVGKPKVVL